VKILIVDDHALVRRGMSHVVRESFPDAEIVEAATAAEALDAMTAVPTDIALVDVRMPDADGLELLHEMKARWPDVPVIMLTSFDHAQYVRRALAEGAAGYMLKDATPEDLEQAIKVALSGGGNVLSPRVIQNLFETMDAAKGIGLAANQVGVSRRVAVVDAEGTRFAMVNPVITSAEPSY